mgnify:CR=1 FL=1
MRKTLMTLLNVAALLCITSVAFAADAAAEVPLATGLIKLAAAFGMAIAAAGCGIGQGLGLKAACEGTARNPEAGGKIMVTLILGLAFVESLAIYALVVNLMLIL